MDYHVAQSQLPRKLPEQKITHALGKKVCQPSLLHRKSVAFRRPSCHILRRDLKLANGSLCNDHQSSDPRLPHRLHNTTYRGSNRCTLRTTSTPGRLAPYVAAAVPAPPSPSPPFAPQRQPPSARPSPCTRCTASDVLTASAMAVAQALGVPHHRDFHGRASCCAKAPTHYQLPCARRLSSAFQATLLVCGSRQTWARVQP